MMALYDVPMAKAINAITEELRENHPELSKSMAKTLVCNALIYNTVINEILGQVEFIMENDEE